MAIFTKPGFLGLQSSKKYRQKQKDKNTPRVNRVTKKLQGLFRMAIIFMLLMAFIWIFINKELMPVIQSMARYEANMAAIKAINEGVGVVLRKNKVTTHDLLFYDYNEDGEIVSWNVNSIMINNLCTEVSEKVVYELDKIGTIPLKIPSGTVTGANIFSALGPGFSMKVFPRGSATVDYKNQLKATGINQVNHVVWLEIEATIQVMAPLSAEEMIVQRKVILVDKVISGRVPSNYINIPGQY